MTGFETIGHRLNPDRKCWADLVDSSQECSKDETVPRAPLVDDSYETGTAPGMSDNSRDGLNLKLSQTELEEVVRKAGDDHGINLSFLLKPKGGNGTSLSSGNSGSTSSTTSTGAVSKELNPSAPAFVPTAQSDTVQNDMPPPASKGKRLRGKRALSSVQDPAVKRTRELPAVPEAAPPAGQSAPPPQRVDKEPPPFASEEDWQHRIGKRVKVVNSIKDTPEYRGYLARRPVDQRLDGEPRTPKAEDRLLSKRRWEYEIQQWRTQLKEWAATNNITSDATMQVDEAAPARTGSEESEE
jgi:hypothetical protein